MLAKIHSVFVQTLGTVELLVVLGNKVKQLFIDSAWFVEISQNHSVCKMSPVSCSDILHVVRYEFLNLGTR